jgi:hypothetical protein
MSLFDWLLVTHLVGDFLLQSNSMARRKVTEWSWMLRHIGSYMAVVALPVIAYAIRHSTAPWLVVLVLVFIAGTHILMDRRDLIMRWMRFADIRADYAWLAIVADQVFHILSLAVVAQVMAMVGS